MIISAQSPDLVAQSFLNRQAAQGVTLTSTQRDALRQLAKDLAAIGLSKFKSVYPFVGGTAAAHALNLLGSDFPVTWYGTVTHNANGIQGDGATGYGDTGLSADALTNTSNHFAIYSRSASTPSGLMCDMGAENGSYGLDLHTRRSDGLAFFRSNVVGYTNFYPDVKSGFFCGSRNGDTTRFHRNDGTEFTTHTQTPGAAFALNIFIAAWNSSGAAARFSDSNLAFACAGSGLTQAEMVSLYTAVQTFETTLGRQL